MNLLACIASFLVAQLLLSWLGNVPALLAADRFVHAVGGMLVYLAFFAEKR